MVLAVRCNFDDNFCQVVETSVTVSNNSPFQDYPHPDNHPTLSTVTPGFKPFTCTVLFLRGSFIASKVGNFCSTINTVFTVFHIKFCNDLMMLYEMLIKELTIDYCHL